MVLLCEEKTDKNQHRGIRILECRSLDSLAVIPKEIEGLPVTELGPYVFSDRNSRENEIHDRAFWWSEEEGRTEADIALSMPYLKGSRLEELRLPETIEKVGAYGFYNCERMKKLEVFSTTLDWGAGVFTGCSGINELVFHVDEERKSCMKEVLAELRQTLLVTYLGKGKASLIFSEFFEEAVENTPARILVTNTHGCGIHYRNAFVKTQFQFQEYDSLFPHVKVQESGELVSQMALGRVLYPYQLLPCYEEMYQEYLKEHKVLSACQAAARQEMEALDWLMEHMDYDSEQIDTMIEKAAAAGDGGIVSYLMEQKRKKGKVRRKRFRL